MENKTVIHDQPHWAAGAIVRIKKSATHFQYPNFGGEEFRVEDWWDKMTGGSWGDAVGNPACIVYALRAVENKLPDDDEVVYGKLGSFGCLLHVSEIETD